MPTFKKIRKSLENPTAIKRRYRDFNYPSFLGWALESVLINTGTVPEDHFGPGL